MLQKKWFFRNLVLVSVLAVLASTVFAGELMPFSGNASQNGTPISSGDLRVYIYDVNSGGNLIYDSGSDFTGAVTNGSFDVTLGSITELDLNYGTTYYLDFAINGTNLNFNGADRKAFQSTYGSVVPSITSWADARYLVTETEPLFSAWDYNYQKLNYFPAPCAQGKALNSLTGNCVSILGNYGDTNTLALINSLDLNNSLQYLKTYTDTNTQTAGWTLSTNTYLVDTNMNGHNITNLNNLYARIVWADQNHNYGTIYCPDGNIVDGYLVGYSC